MYLEIKQWNEEAKEKITKCKSLKELKSLFKGIRTTNSVLLQ